MFLSLRNRNHNKGVSKFWHTLLIFILSVFNLQAREKSDSLATDTLFQTLESVEIVGSRYGSLKEGGSIELSKEMIFSGSHVLGEPDALKNVSRLSGVSTAGDYGSGLIIDGNLPSHVLYRIDGVPVFFPFRFGGIFSTFNAGHFSSVNFERGIHRGNMPNRLGALLDFNTSTPHTQKFSGSANIGLLSSSLSLFIPAGKKITIAASARISYLDQVYGWILKRLDNMVKYNFQDFNLTFDYNINSKNSLTLNSFFSTDHLTYLDDNYAMDTRMNWQNGLASLAWTHYGDFKITNRAYVSIFSNSLNLLMPQFDIKVPSSVLMAGLSGESQLVPLSDIFSLSAGYELNYYRNNVQEVEISDGNVRPDQNRKPLEPFEARLFCDTRFQLPHSLSLEAGLSASLYCNSSGYFKVFPDPRVTLNIPAGPGTVSLHLGKYTQLLHQVGFSQMGLASDFWIACGEKIQPEQSLNFEIDYSGSFSPYAIYFSANIYARRFFDQPEYMGELLSIIDSGYLPENYIVSANGFAVGANLQFRKSFGRLTGTIGAGYGIARRKLPEFDHFTRSRSENGLTANIALDFRINRHWNVGADFRYNTGRPYTPVKALYFIAGNLMKEFGEPNSALLPAWHRLDLSATWKTESRAGSYTLTHMINIAILNVYGRKNPEFITYVLNIKQGTIGLKTVSSLYRFLPSLSYTIQF